MGEVEDVKMYESAGPDGVQVLLTKRDSGAPYRPSIHHERARYHTRQTLSIRETSAGVWSWRPSWPDNVFVFVQDAGNAVEGYTETLQGDENR